MKSHKTWFWRIVTFQEIYWIDFQRIVTRPELCRQDIKRKHFRTKYRFLRNISGQNIAFAMKSWFISANLPKSVTQIQWVTQIHFPHLFSKQLIKLLTFFVSSNSRYLIKYLSWTSFICFLTFLDNEKHSCLGVFSANSPIWKKNNPDIP